MGFAGRALRGVLVIGLLGVGGPVWRHAHPGGDRPHSHKQASHAAAGHVHAHDHGPHDQALDGHAHEHGGMEEAYAHAHVVVLGVEFTLPIESDEEDSQAGRIAFLVDAPPAVERAEAVSFFDVQAEPAADGGRPVQIVPAFASITAVAAPLCDTARHERSGVQLI